MVYLAGPGRANEHDNPHLVAGHDIVTFAVDPGAQLSRDDALDVANALDQPRRVHGAEVTVPVKEYDEATGRKVTVGRRDAHVWHCSLSLGADDGALSDAQWKRIAEDFVSEMGFTDPDGAKSSRWAAVRHGKSKQGHDHIHIVVQLVREDGTKAPVHRDFARAQEASNLLERRYGLAVLESREANRGSLAGLKPAELERAAAEGRPAAHKTLLRQRVRSAVALAGDEREFISRLRENHILVRPRFAEDSTSKIEGYSVALEPGFIDGKRQKPVWYAPSKIDRSLGLGQLRARWEPDSEARAVASWQVQAQRSRATETGAGKITARQVPVAIAKRLNSAENSGTMNAAAAADFAAVLAHLSVTIEKGTPGPFARAADAVAAGHQRNVPTVRGAPVGYHARLMQRALSRDSVVGWQAVAQQALRLTRLMNSTTLRHQPQLAARVDRELTAGFAQRPELVAAAAGRERPPVTAERPRPPGINQSNRDSGYGR